MRITTDCPRCGRVELGADDVTLVVSPREGIAWYLFDCVGCVRQVVKAAATPVVAALSRVQIPVQMLPAEVLERDQDADGPPLGVDDLLDLILLLRSRSHVADLPLRIGPA